MTTLRLLCLGTTALLVLACGDLASFAAQKPEGWESLDDDNAVRLYYQFVDERRQVRFVESLDDVPEDQRATVGFVKMAVPPPLSPGDARRARASRSGPTRASRPTSSGDIVLYSAEWCGACKKAKRWLDRNDVEYELRDVDDPRFAEELLDKTGRRAVPVLDAGGRVLTGFRPESYEKVIAGS
ncbi:MAG: glutaredoxin family protein [Proteobacteria bacterium]|nr:glutaredoxin family protein [Pseudomonadota bacterium]